MTVSFHVYDRLSEVPLDNAEWTYLVSRSSAGSVFLSKLWIETWWTYYGEGNQMCFVTAERKGEVLAFAPLMIDARRTLRFIGDTHSDSLGFVVPDKHTHLVTGMFEALNGCEAKWNVIHLRKIPRESAGDFQLETSARSESLLVWNSYSIGAPYLRVSGNDSIRKLLAKYSLRRAEKLLREQGELSFEVFLSDDRAAHFWEAFAAQHIERCHQDGRESQLSNSIYLRFLRTLFESDIENTHVHFSALFLDNQTIAFHYGFISQNRLLWYKPSFDVAIPQGSPGTVLIVRLIEYVQENSIGELDFTIGDEPFKDRFCQDRRVIDDYRIHRSRIGYLLDTGYWRLRQTLKKAIK